MIFDKTNIEEKLLHLKQDKEKENRALREVYQILNSSSPETEIQSRLAKSGKATKNDFIFDLLDTNKIFHKEQIKKICTDYRLRFLDSKYFKGKIPQSALTKIRNLEEQHDTQLKGFKIMAPSKLFKLEDKDDPLLFAPIGNDYYYLIHKWGNDLHPLRKLLVWPFKDIVNLTLTTLLISYLVTLLIPNGLFSKRGGAAEFWIMFFFMFKSLAAIVIFYGFALGKNFNPAIWNSKYYNA